MKMLNEFWNPKNVTEENSALDYFKNTVLTTNKGKGYYNTWETKRNYVESLDIETLNRLNTVLFEKFDKEQFKKLVKENIKVIPIIPMIMLSNEDEIHIMEGEISYKFKFNKKSYTEEEYNSLFEILELADFYVPMIKKYASNIKDYLTLVLVGMDTNGRKNRSGTRYEETTKSLLNSFCDLHGFKKIHGANKKRVEETFGKEVLEKIESAGKDIPDFMFQTDNNIFMIETNYSDGGSKLQASIESFIELSNKIKNIKGVKFIYITDGKQWKIKKSTHLSDGWKNIDYIVNVNMIKEGILEHILKEEEK
jgi:type II restriction enzyme